MSHHTKGPLPGSTLPSIELPLVGGGNTDLSKVAAGSVAKLLVVYRGQFCPFCKGSLTGLQAKLPALEAAGWEVLCVSADPVDVAAKMVSEYGLTYPVAGGLTEQHMRSLGTYVSDPKNYQPQTYPFSEPAFFVLDGSTGAIKYRCEASCPMAGRPDVDAVLAGFAWSKQNAIEHPEYVGHVWGAK